MRWPRLTIGRLLVLIAVVAVDLMVVLDEVYGLLTLTISLNVGLVRLARPHSDRRDAWTSFVLAGMTLLILVLVLRQIEPLVIAEYLGWLLNQILIPLSRRLGFEEHLDDLLDGDPSFQIFALTVLELGLGVPLILLAISAGWVARWCRRWRRAEAEAPPIDRTVGPAYDG